MNIRDEDIQAYVDGELAGPDAERIEAAILADVLVAARVDRERRLRAAVRGAYDGVVAEPVPDRLLAQLRAEPAAGADAESRVVDLTARREARAPSRWRVPAYAMAASVALVAAVVWMRGGQGGVGVDPDGMVAQGPLARALERGLAAEPAGDVGIGLTFRDEGGRICRSFAEAAVAGLACREDGRWRLEVLARAGGDAGEIRQASSAMPPEVQAAIDTRLAGDVFDAETERAARDAGWR